MSPPKRAAESTEALRAMLIQHARDLVSREGASALTMRALAAEAGCAVGMPYKVFADRQELVGEICHAEFAELGEVYEELVARAGTATVGSNLAWFADLLLDSPAVALAHEVFADAALMEAVAARVDESGIGPGGFETAFTRYLAAEKEKGRVARDIDEDAFGFLLAGAIHNLIVSGDAWPRPTRRQMKRRLEAVAAAIAVRR